MRVVCSYWEKSMSIKKESCERSKSAFSKRNYCTQIFAGANVMDYRNLLRCFFLSLAFCLSLQTRVSFGQTATATLTGIVSASTGALLPNVLVSVRNTAQNNIQSARTNETGSYVLPALYPGDYFITAELPGFKRFVREDVTIQANQVARVDIRLDLGSIEETIEVKAAPPLLETETSGRGAVIDRQKINELPLNGRDYNQLALLAPGVVPSTPRLAVLNFKGAMNVNGNRVFKNTFLLDRLDNITC